MTNSGLPTQSASALVQSPASIERLDGRLDAIVPAGAPLEVVADFTDLPGPHWLESPVWDPRQQRLLFSDVKANAIHAWDAVAGSNLFLQPSGYSGIQPFQGEEPGANGLAFDRQGRLLICEHGDRRVRRMEPDGRRTVMADRYQGHRLNSPNDVVCRANGDIYFTDPPFGLPGRFDDPDRELPFSGVYRLAADGGLKLLVDDLKAPNGLAFSPDGRTFYLSDSSQNQAAVLAYDVREDGRLERGRVLLDVTARSGLGGPDGMEVDTQGTLYVAGREAVFVLAADGTPLGTIATGAITTNVGWGEDGLALFIATERRLLRLRLRTRGSDF